jgi:hypothetical protein
MRKYGIIKRTTKPVTKFAKGLAQAEEVVEPFPGVSNPDGQEEHAICPSNALYCPTGHLEKPLLPI